MTPQEHAATVREALDTLVAASFGEADEAFVILTNNSALWLHVDGREEA